jgi:DNA-binding transcriptional MerR regulator
MQRHKPQSVLMTREQAASALNISIPTLRNLERDGSLRPIRLRASKHSQVFYEEQQVLALQKGV